MHVLGVQVLHALRELSTFMSFNKVPGFDTIRKTCCESLVKCLKTTDNSESYECFITNTVAMLIETTGDFIVPGEFLDCIERSKVKSEATSNSTRTSLLSSSSKSSSKASIVSNVVKPAVVLKKSNTHGDGGKLIKSIPTYPVTLEQSKNYKNTRAVVRNLSTATSDFFVKQVKPEKIYKYCSQVNCSKCSVLYDNVHLTKCNHTDNQKCSDVGLYPHLSRSVWKSLHGKQHLPTLVCYSKHFLNPRARSSGIEVQDRMETCELDQPSITAAERPKMERQQMDRDAARRAKSKAECDELDAMLQRSLFGKLSERSRSEYGSSSSGLTVPGGQCPCGSKLMKCKSGALACFKFKTTKNCPEWEKIVAETLL